jgi:lipopolysaccharide transport system ATP-binding protein
MSMRLGYAVAMLARPDILVLDEILAVGDQRFQKKCMDHIRRVRQSGTSILFVSHSIYHVRQMCDRAIWIQNGEVVASGDPTRVTDDYVNFTYAQSGGQEAQKAERGIPAAEGNASHLTKIRISKEGESSPCTEFATGEVMEVTLSFKNIHPKENVHLGIICNRNDDLQVFTTRSREAGLHASGETGSLVVRVPVQLAAGEYYMSGFLLDETCDHVLDQRLAWSRFRVKYDGMEKGVYIAPVKWMPGDKNP